MFTMVDANNLLLSKSQSYNYENCILRDHDSNDSASSAFSWGRAEDGETSSFSETTSEDSLVEDHSHRRVSLKDYFILMVGFLCKIEEHLNEQLADELRELRSILLNSAEAFGYVDRSTRPNGKLASIPNQSIRADILTQTQSKTMNEALEINSDCDTAKVSRRTPAWVQNGKQPQNNLSGDNHRISKGDNICTSEIKSLSPIKEVQNTRSLSSKCPTKNKTDGLKKSMSKLGSKVCKEASNGELAKNLQQSIKSDILKQTPPKKMNGAEINSDTAKVSRRKPTRIENAIKNGKSKEDPASEKIEQNKQPQKRKADSLSGDNRRISKRVKKNVCLDRLSYTASKIRQATDSSQKSLSPIKEVRRTRSLGPKRPTKGKSDGNLSQSMSKVGPKVCKEASNGAANETKLHHNLSSRSEKRKLYSSESWLDILSSTLL